MKFKVIIGTHRQEGREYTKGQIVTSESDLVKLFPGKFQKVLVAEEVEVEEKDDAPPSSPKTLASRRSSAGRGNKGQKQPPAGEKDEDWEKDKESEGEKV